MSAHPNRSDERKALEAAAQRVRNTTGTERDEAITRFIQLSDAFHAKDTQIR